ncbi:twin-arginine translocase TatA/TatE family subunit [Rhodospirillum rubrum]|uniref:twin-arginine translocase TatA/TatE family subunit n=1 Tax=Rhodospirillum rubrum TaxID=1085 RepID=UPI0019080B07|nr:twin-arginine translocase TatA/TatE family subunit [Rhodospirillum rubrum]MBK1663573.1 twin-arginine translocase TatA/TatE family subunit [Rhodospirillum rubrum]MBK1675626.1 twin-arginine translocase TatA/TatE family subunit [Rhodospirillum rubrum]
MGFSSIWHWIIVLVVVLLLFGAGKIPRLMGDVAKGVKAFKKGMADDEDDEAAPVGAERRGIEDGKPAQTIYPPQQPQQPPQQPPVHRDDAPRG